MDVNWFPGHMARTLRELAAAIQKVDLVVETCDARLPESSRNPELNRILGSKPRILVLNKADLADPRQTEKWLVYYRQKNLPALACEGLRRSSLEPLRSLIIHMNQAKIDRAKARGRLIRPIRVMVVGIPNTGKSTLINTLCGRKAAPTEDRPGVTRQLNWIRAGSDLELLDTPGVLWPKLGGPESQRWLAASGAIRDDRLPIQDLAMDVLYALSRMYPESIRTRYKLADLNLEPLDLFEAACRQRGCLLPGGRPDYNRFAALFLDDLRAGRLGRISLEWPEAVPEAAERGTNEQKKDE
jgi:ribosome biogenesis GTPase A